MSKIIVAEPMVAQIENSEFLIKPLGKDAPLFKTKYEISKNRKLIPSTGDTLVCGEWSKQGTELHLEVGQPLRLGSFTSIGVVQAIKFVEPHH